MRVEIDTERCSGHGRCYALEPSVFVDDEAGYGQVIDAGALDDVALAAAERAAAACPERAITIHD